jgi:Kef-type K+ transport system membrane component KefB
MTDVDFMLRFLVQLLLILAACKGAGWIGKKYFGQTQVVMEMITGIVLGPSLFGLLKPEWQSWIFPTTLKLADGSTMKHPSMNVLYVVAQIGLIFTMFLVGNEFDPNILKQRARGAMAVSLTGMAAPFILGAGLTLALIGPFGKVLFPEGITNVQAALFMGASMCITAFPVLARMLLEHGITRTPIGTICLASGAIDDASAWTLLAIVMGMFHNDPTAAAIAMGGGVAFTTFMLTLGSRWLARLGRHVEETGRLSQASFSIFLLVLFATAGVTDAIGLHAVFGAFLAGIAMPKGRFAVEVRERLEAVTVGCLVPCFFVYSGLNTRLGLLESPALWGVCGLVILAAILGKGGGCTLAAKASGESWRDSFTIGALMNTRGLMELIIANIGLQQGIISPTLFAMLVIMAVVTTLMTSPIFKWLYRPQSAAAVDGAAAVSS